jgi:hypothetical protein
MTFAEAAIGDRFASGDNPINRKYQKVSMFSALDVSEGINRKGQYVVDQFNPTDTIVLRNDIPSVTDYNPEKVIRGETL